MEKEKPTAQDSATVKQTAKARDWARVLKRPLKNSAKH
jgi:hypothetical protein